MHNMTMVVCRPGNWPLIAVQSPNTGGKKSQIIAGVRQPKILFQRASIIPYARGNSSPSTNGDEPPMAMSEALARREEQLWQRQERLMDQLDQQHASSFNTLMKMHEQVQEQYMKEREAWSQQEAALKQELAEARSQMLYLLSCMGATNPAVAPPSPFPAQPAPQAFSNPQAASYLSPGDQVKAVVDAVRSGAVSLPPQQQEPLQQQQQQQTSASDSSFASDLAQMRDLAQSESSVASDTEAPSYAHDLAAAFAAVEETDVLSDEIDFQAIAARIAAGKNTAAALAEQQAQQQQSYVPSDDGAQVDPSVPKGPPPPLALGADDIFWVNQLHLGLVEEGYFPGEEDIEDFFFGDSTQTAVMTLQACSGLAETGVVDDDVWRVVLGQDLVPRPSHDLLEDLTANMPLPGQQQQGGKPFQELFSASFHQEVVTDAASGQAVSTSEVHIEDDVVTNGKWVHDETTVKEDVIRGADGSVQRSGSVERTHHEQLTKWPVLMEGDGGREVHALHVALQNHGYYASSDDLVWWTYGDATVNTIKTFQVCAGLPESGVCDINTWRALMGPDAVPADMYSLWSGGSDDEDMSIQSSGRVWLMGEGRWAQDSSGR